MMSARHMAQVAIVVIITLAVISRIPQAKAFVLNQ